mmetsp:Transcript_131653/g.253365  ORF Transcript_131653/g.253365 Transcript_131653/m.253365 type:complete len:102 (+) Transcript_131653:250-555(+)
MTAAAKRVGPPSVGQAKCVLITANNLDDTHAAGSAAAGFDAVALARRVLSARPVSATTAVTSNFIEKNPCRLPRWICAPAARPAQLSREAGTKAVRNTISR